MLDPSSLNAALQGVEIAYYLVHLMAASTDFEREDRQAATNFAEAAKKAGVRRIIYLGGLGDDSSPKSVAAPSQPSRGREDSAGKRSRVHRVPSLPRDWSGESLLRSRPFARPTGLPVMICPRWLTTPTQPIAVDDVLAYLLAAMDLASWPKPHLRDRRHGCRHLWRHHSRICPAAKATKMADLGARA